MKIVILMGSPNKNGSTGILVDSFVQGAESAGHTCEIIDVCHANIHPCIGCVRCGYEGPCVQKDDVETIRWKLLDSDMIVFASPIYYFTLSAQLQAVIHRTYSIDIPKNVKKVALIMSSGSAYVYGPAIAQYYQSIVEYWGVENAGIFTANGKQNKSEEKRQELYRFGKSL